MCSPHIRIKKKRLAILSTIKRREGRRDIAEASFDFVMALAVYLLGFSTYNGFSKVAGNVVDDVDENALKRIYEYARRIVKKD